MMKWWHLLISIIVSIAIGFVIGSISHRNEPICRDIVKVDTLYHTDTITQIKPIYVEKKITDSIEVKVVVRDTIEVAVQLPREEKTYEDTSYKAIVSGYQPSLDFIETYEKTRVVTQVEYIKPSRWGFSLQLGTGLIYDIPKNRLGYGIYGGVGICYRF